jgi:GUN4-like
MGIFVLIILGAFVWYFFCKDYFAGKMNINPNNKLDISLVRLDELLKSQDFESANTETYYLLREICGIRQKDWISPQDINSCDRGYLETIDELWVSNSDNKFGFRIQKEIWVKLYGEKQIGEEATGYEINEFTNKLGWTMDGVQILLSDYDFTMNSPIGHLPVIAKPGRINAITNVDTCYEPKSSSWIQHLQEIWRIL